jgi:hypothetical protein
VSSLVQHLLELRSLTRDAGKTLPDNLAESGILARGNGVAIGLRDRRPRALLVHCVRCSQTRYAVVHASPGFVRAPGVHEAKGFFLRSSVNLVMRAEHAFASLVANEAMTVLPMGGAGTNALRTWRWGAPGAGLFIRVNT